MNASAEYGSRPITVTPPPPPAIDPARLAELRAKVADGFTLSIGNMGRPQLRKERKRRLGPGKPNRHHLVTIIAGGLERTLHATKGWRIKRA